MPGLGQIYLGYYQQGFTNMAIFAGCITALSSNRLEGIEPFIALGMAFFFMYNMIDANRRAHHLNRVAAGLSPEQFPDEFPLPKPRSSMFGGVIMIAHRHADHPRPELRRAPGLDRGLVAAGAGAPRSPHGLAGEAQGALTAAGVLPVVEGGPGWAALFDVIHSWRA
jgi:hypothetical protein